MLHKKEAVGTHCVVFLREKARLTPGLPLRGMDGFSVLMSLLILAFFALTLTCSVVWHNRSPNGDDLTGSAAPDQYHFWRKAERAVRARHRAFEGHHRLAGEHKAHPH